MPKVYAIMRDNVDILVGSGGKSGKNPRPRTGLHLPGGTIDPREQPRDAAIREVREEAGINLLPHQVINNFQLTLDGYQVHFFVFQVHNVTDTIRGRAIPRTVNPDDEPFTALQGLRFNLCINNQNFSQIHKTDWFAKGLSHAGRHSML